MHTSTHIYPTADPGSLSHIARSVGGIKTVDPVAVGDEVSFIDPYGRVWVLPGGFRMTNQTRRTGGFGYCQEVFA